MKTEKPNITELLKPAKAENTERVRSANARISVAIFFDDGTQEVTPRRLSFEELEKILSYDEFIISNVISTMVSINGCSKEYYRFSFEGTGFEAISPISFDLDAPALNFVGESAKEVSERVGVTPFAYIDDCFGSWDFYFQVEGDEICLFELETWRMQPEPDFSTIEGVPLATQLQSIINN